MSVTEAKSKFEDARKKFFEAKKAAESLQKRQVELTQRLDVMRENLPVLQRNITDARTGRAKIFDDMILNEASKDDLKRCDKALEQAEREYLESQEICAALERGVKNCETELPKLHTQADLQKRACWESIADEIYSKIPEGVISDIQRLVVASMQCSRTKQFVLSELLPNLNPSEYPTRRDELINKYSINE